MKKKIVLFFILLLLLVIVIGCKKADSADSADSEASISETVKSDSQEKKAVTALENYFHCIGNDDLKSIENYATDYGLQMAQFLIALLSKDNKEFFKNYKADIIESEFENECYYITVKIDIIDSRNPTCFEITKDGNNWKVNDTATVNKELREARRNISTHN